MPELQKQLEEIIFNHAIDDTVPALTFLLAAEGVRSGVGKRVFVAYVVESIDRTFKRLQENDSE
jgi:hypothetical protein